MRDWGKILDMDEFWKSSTPEVLDGVCDDLVRLGVPEDEATSRIVLVVSAIRNEYGE